MARPQHKKHRFLSLAVILVATICASAHADIQPQIQTVTLQPQPLTDSSCAMIETDGTPTHQYTTVAAQNGIFAFNDPVPSGAILNDIVIRFDTLATCVPSNLLQVNLNLNMPGVNPAETLIGIFGSTGSTAVCASKKYSQIAIGPLSLLLPAFTPYVRGGLNELEVTELGPGCPNVRIDKVQIDVSYYVDAPSISFELSAASNPKERMILMNKFRNDDDYISSAQKAVQPTAFWGKDNHVLIRGQALNPDGTPYANQTVYLRPVDPPDPADYVYVGESHRGDNTGGSVEGFADGFQYFGAWLWPVTTDQSGAFSATLATASSFAGDNQQVEASAIPLLYLPSQDRCTPTIGCYTSGVITPWRRIYIESDHMFRAGAFLTQDALPGDTRLHVSDGDPFRTASTRHPIPVLLIHAPTGPGDTFYQEPHHVVNVTGPQSDPAIHLAHNESIKNPFVAIPYSPMPSLWAGDAVGVYRGPDDVFPSNLSLLQPLFAEAFTDVMILPPSANRGDLVPYADCSDQIYCGAVAARWFDNRVGDNAAPNHIHLVNASTEGPGTIGATLLHRGPSLSPFKEYTDAPIVFTWNAQIESVFGQGANIVVGEDAAHEMVHTFDVNQPVNRTVGGHCSDMAWNNAVDSCLMSINRTNAERAAGNTIMHNNPWFTSEYRRIRRRPDPLPQANQDSIAPNY